MRGRCKSMSQQRLPGRRAERPARSGVPADTCPVWSSPHPLTVQSLHVSRRGSSLLLDSSRQVTRSKGLRGRNGRFQAKELTKTRKSFALLRKGLSRFWVRVPGAHLKLSSISERLFHEERPFQCLDPLFDPLSCPDFSVSRPSQLRLKSAGSAPSCRVCASVSRAPWRFGWRAALRTSPGRRRSNSARSPTPTLHSLTDHA